jgi:PAS domain S-box-containing protein
MDSKKPYTPPSVIAHLQQTFPERTHKRGQVTPAYTTVVDNTRVYVDVSHSFCQLVGYARAELLGMRYDHLTAPNTADIPATYNLFSKLGYLHGLWVLLHRTGYRILVRYESWVRQDTHIESNIEVVQDFRGLGFFRS